MSVPETKPTVLVLTALALEYAAVRAYVEEREERVHPNGTRVETGRLPDSPWRVAISELGVGAERAAALATRLIEWLKPQAVFFVGVAGSLKKDVGIGDVVVGTDVYEIHGGKQTDEGFKVRPKALPGSHALEQAARSAARDLADVVVHFAPVATGDVVLADAESAIARHLESHYNDAAAIEMEGSGAARAAHFSGQLDALVIRGISDRANADKAAADAGGSQQLAAAQAAAVTMAVLHKHRPRDGGSADSEEGPRGRPAGHGGEHIDFRGGVFLGPVIGKQVGGQQA
ncbi:5'-methylthioadenosine/S-adenosylhomocysteine nucleosidase [Streptomyces actinomycinicus]|uniref:5'-methylthioadenosine/S-adenosylhomocysteine nucleosidase n=1 Tax=Streptomyces actinomycinicus TaxID=1695166 RepID=A0A937JPK2_9ACTN|nr:5'-methylthioadenosine/S-adenosylhomocysteine nucleosidase [Streptomyces actinomycinicus]MBL1085735.1 5'-methylthioadenosine/S-adenosylhomocysteine nucleosidase [Streptomyces actinomycinicus]